MDSMYDCWKNAFIISQLALLFSTLYLKDVKYLVRTPQNESLSNAFLTDYERQMKMIIDFFLHLYHEF